MIEVYKFQKYIPEMGKPVMRAGFFGWGGPTNVWGPIFEGRNEILLLDKALKFRVICQKYALKLIKIRRTIENIRKTWKNSRNFLNFGRDEGNNTEYTIGTLYRGSGAEPLKFSRIIM